MHEKGFETRPSMLGVTQQRAFMPVYIEKVEIWSGVTYPSQTTMGLLSLPKIQSLS